MSNTLLGFNKSNVVLAAGVAGAAFLGYCIYFDFKRTTAPDYKDKIRQKRRAQAGKGAAVRRAPVNTGAPLNVSDPSSMQAFFLQEVQIGEEMMAAGNVEEGAVHLANAVLLCGQSQSLLSVFQQTLSDEQFRAIINELPATRERLSTMFGQQAEEAENEPPVVQYVGEGPVPPQIQTLIDDTDDLE